MILELLRNKLSKPIISDFSTLKTDIHSHLVPKLDDGSDSMETSLLLIKGLVDLGYEKIITTPHIRPEYFPNTPATISNGFEELKKAVKKENIQVGLECAAEYFIDYEFLDKMEKDELLTFSGNHLLIEVSTYSPPPNLKETIFQLRLQGYRPVLAHPERYTFYTVEELKKLKELGCVLQVNIMSLMGHYGRKVRDLAFKLIKVGAVDLLGSDMHHVRHLEILRKTTSNGTIMNMIAANNFRNAKF